MCQVKFYYIEISFVICDNVLLNRLYLVVCVSFNDEVFRLKFLYLEFCKKVISEI